MTVIRDATPLDLPFLEQMPYEAFFWNGEPEGPALVERRTCPEFRSLLAAWGRVGGNPARALYESEGFRKVGEVGTSWTMLRELST